jgi:quercetin dioxygenase-like cupin family protein
MNLLALHTEEKEVSTKPLFKGGLGTAAAIKLDAKSVLKEHLSKIPALMLCVTGEVTYEDESKNKIELVSGDYVNIIPNIKHWLTAKTNSNLVLFK